MNSKWTKLAAVGVLSLCTAVPALAGSVTQPGETVGLNTGAPLPPGWYVINTVDWGCRNTTPTHTCTGLTIPVIAIMRKLLHTTAAIRWRDFIATRCG